MNPPPAANLCAECGAALGGHHWRVCVACGRMFCRRHLIIGTDKATCIACHARDPRPAEAGGKRTGGSVPED